MALVRLTIFVVLPLLATVEAGKITFVKINNNIFVETDPFNYAMYGPITDKDGLRIVAINGETHNHQTSRCVDATTSLYGLKIKQQEDYRKVRDAFLEEKGQSPAISGIPASSYVWSGLFFSDEIPEYSAIRLDDKTVVYSSQHFPKTLARVIISNYIVIFIHYNGDITMKDANCLYINEKILYDGIKKIDVDGKKNSLVYPKGDKALRKHLKSHRIDDGLFNSEQHYVRTLSDEEIASVERAIRFLDGEKH